MGRIQTDTDGLLALAAQCQAMVARLGAASTPAPTAGGFAPSALAVAAAHTEVAAAGARMSARMASTAAAATAAANGYASSDAGNAADIAAVGTTAV